MSFISPGEKRNPYLRADSLSDLLSWNDVDFVRCAYVTILGRQPDPEGEAYYTDRIRRGYSKMHVLWQLRTSREGPHHDPGIAGLDRALKKARWGRSRVIGWLVRVFTGSEGDGQGIRRHREILNQLVMLSQNHQALADRMAGPLTSQAQPIDLGQEAPSPSQSFLREAEMRLSPKALNLYRRTLSI